MSKNNYPGRILKGTKTPPSLKGASGVWTLDEALQYHRANQWPQPNLYQPIPNSLRSKASSTSYFYRNTPRLGNRMTWTWSAWVKRSSTGTNTGNRNGLFGSGDNSQTNLFRLYFNATDNLVVQDTQNSTDNIVVVTTQVFRDINAWYHIIVAMDTTQGTSANRVKVYVNGVQVTSFSTSTYPTQGYTTMINGGFYESTGACYNPPTTAYVVLDGYIAEHNFVDGQQLQPTLFGQSDSNNAWVPVAYTGTYGTNGFYLPFTNTTTSQTLGYDASLNGTPTYSVDQDPYRGSVVLHLDGNGPAGGQNNTFIDSSLNNLSITRQGSVITQGSFSPFPLLANTTYNPAIHGASGWFNNTPGENLLVTASSANALSTGTFTVEAWVYWIPKGSTPNGNSSHYIFSQGNNASNVQWALSLSNSGTIYWGFTGAGVTTSAACSPNTWNHIAVTRDSGNTERIFLNGSVVNTRTNTTNYNSVSSYQIQVGSSYDTNFPSAYSVNSYGNTLYGYISSARIVIGSAVYTAAFSPMMRPFSTLTNNLLPFSEDFSNNGTWWNWVGITVKSAAAVAPDGTPSAQKIIFNTGTISPAINSGVYFPVTAGNTYTFSVYIKSAELFSGNINVVNNAYTSGASVNFNLTTSTVSSGAAVGTGTYINSTITNAGNGWYRVSVTGVIASGTLGNITVSPYNTSGNNFNITGDGVSGFYIWGAQVDLASSPAIYTPTPSNYSTAPSLLLNFANAAVVDSAGAQNLITNGTATISSASRFGSGALANNGGTGYWKTTGAPLAGVSDFTIEGWWNLADFATHVTYFTRLFSIGTGLANDVTVNVDNSGYVVFRINDSIQFTASIPLVANTWTHIAFTRNFYNYRLFINGIQYGIVTTSTSLSTQLTYPVYIGSESDGGGGYINGSIDDFRITAGIARYVTNFTPPVRALAEIGGRSFVTQNINAGVVQKFTSNSNTTTLNTSWTAPSDVTQVEVLVVAGGGGGGVCYGGGGGGGGVIYNNAYPVTPGQTYSIQVGRGGTNQINVSGNGGPGTNSSFGNLVAIGGGYGGGNCGSSGGAGGSGGGGSGTGSATTAGGTGTAGQGFSGNTSGTQTGGGGGGAGGGGSATSTGSNGLQFGIVGVPTYYAGGGTGGQASTTAGGSGGGGTGGTSLAAGVGDATVNTGGGGGGSIISGTGISGLGGSGIVIVRYTTATIGNTSDVTTDTLTDSPTSYGHDLGLGGEVVGNYATLNALGQALSGTTTINVQNGGLTAGIPTSGTSGYGNYTSTIAVPATGYWYAEFTVSGGAYVSANNNTVGLISSTTTALSNFIGSAANTYCYFDGDRYTGTFRSNSATSQSIPGFTVGDTLMIALGNGNLWFGKNGLWLGSGNPNPNTSTSPAYSGLSGNYYFACGNYTSPYGYAFTANFGQRAWAYTPPAGYSALTLKNLPRPALGSPVIVPNQFFDVVTWTGTAAAQNITGLNFQPDFVWAKSRSGGYDNVLNDVIRGPGKTVQSDVTSAEVNEGTTGLTAFNSNGFSLGGSSGGWNASTVTYVGWCWKAGGSPVSNTAGTITSQVSANIASGFSVVTYTGNNTAGATVGHGLTSVPNMIIVFRRDTTSGHKVWHSSLTAGQVLELQVTNGVQTIAAFNNAVPTSTTFALGAYSDTNASGGSFVAYCWTAVPGFSAFGSYAANGLADGPFVYTGFKPRFVMLKRYDSGSSESWFMVDSARSTYNPSSNYTLANSANAEGSGTAIIDFLSNGFKPRSTAVNAGSGGPVYIYMAFASAPFTNTNGTAF